MFPSENVDIHRLQSLCLDLCHPHWLHRAFDREFADLTHGFHSKVFPKKCFLRLQPDESASISSPTSGLAAWDYSRLRSLVRSRPWDFPHGIHPTWGTPWATRRSARLGTQTPQSPGADDRQKHPGSKWDHGSNLKFQQSNSKSRWSSLWNWLHTWNQLDFINH